MQLIVTEHLLKKSPAIYLLVLVGGIIACLLGASVLFGWYTHNKVLIQVSPDFVPMQYNTALGFLLSGLALLSAVFGYFKYGKLCSYILTSIGLLTLSEYIFNLNLGLDEFFLKHYVTVETSNPGRMAPNTALCFFISGITLSKFNTTESKKNTNSTSILGSLILGLSVVAFVGYIVGLETAYGWGELTRMAVHTTLGFIFLSIAFISLSCHQSLISTSTLPNWFSVSIGIACMTIVISFWQALGTYKDILFTQLGDAVKFNYIHNSYLIIGSFFSISLSVAIHQTRMGKKREKVLIATNNKLAFEINERKQVEKDFITSETKFHTLFDSTNDAVMIADGDRFIDANKATLKLFGCSTLEEFCSNTVPELSAPEQPCGTDSVTLAKQKINLAIEKGSSHFEWMHKRLDTGETFHADVLLSSFAINSKVFIQATVRNISERKKIEDSLKLCSLVFSETIEGICIRDAKNTIIDINPAFSDITGYSRDDIIGKTFDIFNSAKQSTEFHDEIRGALNDKGHWRGEIWNRKKDGTPYAELQNISIIKDKNNAPLYYVSLFSDISYSKQQNEMLKKAKQDAEHANKVKSEFLASMNHELRTPLHGMLGMTQTLGHTDLTKEQGEIVEIISNSGNSLLAIINAVLDLSKLDAEQLSLESRHFNLEQMCLNVLNMFLAEIKNKNLKTSIDYPTNYPRFFMGDPLRLQQVLINLVGNAVKFTSEGQVNLSVLCKSISSNLIELTIIVKDTGIGISKEKTESLFEPFIQADQSTTRQFGGTGLGLAISKKLINLMNGRIDVESQMGKGTKMSISLVLPITDEAAIPETKELIALNNDFKNKKFLLVEDNEINQIVALSLFKDIGLEVDLAENGQQAIMLFKREHYDLIFMDCRMPGMDGYETTKVIRDLESGTSTPIIALTANSSPEDRLRCLESGMNEVITKPFDKEHLIDIFNQWLDDSNS